MNKRLKSSTTGIARSAVDWQFFPDLYLVLSIYEFSAVMSHPSY